MLNHSEPRRYEPGAVERALIKAARSLSSSLDVDGVCSEILNAVEEIFGATSSWILLHDSQTNLLNTQAFRGEGSQAYAGVSLPPNVGILGLAFTSREVVFVPNAQDDDRWFDPSRVHRAGLRSVFTLPLLYKGAPIGLVGLDSCRFTADDPPNHDDIVRLEALAAQAAIAITNARLYEKSERDRRRLATLVAQRRNLRRRVTQLQDEIREAQPWGEIVSQSPAFDVVLREIALVAPGDTTVLLLGETGTGKELLARRLHTGSARSDGPFVAVNCAALPETLVESELFGHEKGAFTGAIERKPGKFELAHGGTLFLDEVGDLPADAQAKLLRVLQDSEIQRVGATTPVKVDVRVIAATNQDLECAIAERRFRPDLYYRLSAFPIKVPPLRDRPEDISLLAEHFTKLFATKLRRSISEIEPRAVDKLGAYAWPGNVRELQNVIERAVILTTGNILTTEAITLHVSPPPHPPAGQPDSPADRSHNDVMPLADAERHAILRAVERAHWRISGPGGAADMLGLRPTTLHAKMKKLQIRRPSGASSLTEPGAAADSQEVSQDDPRG